MPCATGTSEGYSPRPLATYRDATDKSLRPRTNIPLRPQSTERHALNELDCSVCKSVSDLTPLQDMALTTLNLRETSIVDLSPLRGISLKNLDLIGCRQLVDLSPLKEIKLESFAIGSSGAMKVSDLSVLAGMPLKDIQLNYDPERDKELLRSIKTLEKINLQPSAEFLERN